MATHAPTNEDAAPAREEGHHPLLSVTSSMTLWREWKQEFGAATEAGRKRDLILGGYTMQVAGAEEEVERDCLYMEVADGHNDTGSFNRAGERGLGWHSDSRPFFLGERRSWPEIRQRIARDAFEVFARERLRSHETHPTIPSWAWVEHIFVPEVFRKVLWFFRREGGGIRNYPHRHPERGFYPRIVRAFLMDLCEVGWKFEQYRGHGLAPHLPGMRHILERDSRMQMLLFARRDRFIEILDSLDEIILLLGQSWEFDTACFLKLEQLALGTELSDIPRLTENGLRKERGVPRSMEEAALAGSKAAIVYLYRQRTEAQMALLREQDKALQAKLDAEERLEVLSQEEGR
ncbi:MAG: hypothetical protein HYT31_00340 [Parcubacteria group bacterium]|nr:hypothetical protein [Parcubacteria group bacterium]